MRALLILTPSEEYARYVEASLDDLEVSDHLPVGRCIVIAQSWRGEPVRKQVEGIAIELWIYPVPALWTGPRTTEQETGRLTG